MNKIWKESGWIILIVVGIALIAAGITYGICESCDFVCYYEMMREK